MIKSELIAAIADKVKMTKSDTENVLDAFMEVVKDALVRQEDVRLVGFGVFQVRHRKAKMGRNPKTRAPIEVAASVVPVFRPGQPLKEAVNVVAKR